MPSRYEVLQEDRAKLVKQAGELVNKPEATAEDFAAAKDITDTQIPAIDAQLATIEAVREAERNAPATGAGRMKVVEEGFERDPKCGFANLADFAMSVHASVMAGRNGQSLPTRVAQRLGAMADLARKDREAAVASGYLAAPTNFHQEAQSTDGYMVPPAMRDEIWALTFEAEDIMSLVSPEPTASNRVELTADESTPWGATGVQAYWRAEADQMTPSRLATKGRFVPLHELYAFVLATEELLQDAPRLNARLTTGASRAISWKGSDAFMWGDGTGKPFGWMAAACLVTQTKVTSQAAATINPTNLGAMYARLLSPPGGRPTWFGNRDIMPQLINLVIGDQPVYTPPVSGIKDAPNGSLLGIPLRFTEHAQTLGTKGDIQLVDLAGYYATRRTDAPQFASSIHLYFDYNIQAFRWTFRIGGEPILSSTVAAARGSNTKSHFVCLETRS